MDVAVHVHKPCPACDKYVLRIVKWLKLGAANEDGRLFRELFGNVGPGI
jgi:hypothetical protein